MYSTKTEPNYQTIVQVHGPSNSVNGFLGANSMAYLGKTAASFNKEDSTTVYNYLKEKLASAQIFTVSPLDKYCKFNPTNYYSVPDLSSPAEGSINSITAYPVSGEVSGFFRIDMGTVSYFVVKTAQRECLTQTDVNNQLKPLAREAVDNWWKVQPVNIYWAQNLSRNNFQNPEIYAAITSINSGYLSPLVKASNWFKGWGLV